MPRSPRLLATSVVAALVALTLTAVPAQAVGTPAAPWVKASSPTSLTVDWKDVKGATRYEVFYSTSYAGVFTAKAKKKRTSGKKSELKITGLKEATMYCVSVRALKGGSAGKRSPRHCKWTMRKANDTKGQAVGIATYNVCGKANSCAKTWNSRRTAIRKAVLGAKADVIGFQETSGRIGDLEKLLKGDGYLLAASSSTEAIFYKPKVFTPVSTPVEDCWTEDYRGDTSDWDTAAGTHTGPDGTVYTYHPGPWDGVDSGGWWTYRHCETSDEVEGGPMSMKSQTAAWVNLRSVRTGKTYTIVNAHTTNGKAKSAANTRKAEIQDLVKKLKANKKVSLTRTVILGDFNSHRNRGAQDHPRLELAKSGFHDAYDRSATFTYPQYNSYTQKDGGKGTWSSKPITSATYGDHVDHVFLPDSIGSTSWKVVHFLKNGKYVMPLGSDHAPVRVTAYLP